VRTPAAQEGVDISNTERPQEPLLPAILASVFGCLAIYGVLYGTGELLYFHWRSGTVAIVLAVPMALLMWRFGVLRRRA